MLEPGTLHDTAAHQRNPRWPVQSARWPFTVFILIKTGLCILQVLRCHLHGDLCETKPASGLKCFEHDVSLTGHIGTDWEDRPDPWEHRLMPHYHNINACSRVHIWPAPQTYVCVLMVALLFRISVRVIVEVFGLNLFGSNAIMSGNC